MRLDEYVTEFSLKNFIWGESDCLIFASDWAKIRSGIDPMSKKLDSDPFTIRDEYRTKREAYVLIKKLRGSLENIMDLHFERIDPMHAKTGDIVLASVNDMRPFGIVYGRGQCVFKTLGHGMHFEPLHSCETAWSIPCIE